LNANDLQRLDLADGTVRELLPFGTTWALTVAPDAAKAVYSQGGKLYLLDLATANYASLQVDGLEADVQWGNFIWSPDNRQVAFTIAYAPCSQEWRQSIVVVDVHTQTTRTLIEKDNRLFVTKAWSNTDRLQLGDQDGKTWEVDVTTGAIRMQ
jgi:Tol biopolymer transport system component